jgi:hypothetical protein
MKYVVCYSGGASSSECALTIAKKYGAENVILLNHNINGHIEQACTKKLKKDVADYLGLEVTYANHKDWDTATPVSVCIDAGAWKIGNGNILCTNRLKTDPFKKWMLENDPKCENVYVYGFDLNEPSRITRRSQIMGAMGYKTAFPMTWDESDIVRLENIGIDAGAAYKTFNHSNCFSGDTKFITDKGIFKLSEKVGETVNILNNSGFNKAIVKEYGEKYLVKVKLSNGSRVKTALATENHRWKVSKYDNNTAYGYREVTTKSLTKGNRIQTCYSVPEVDICKKGFQHGFIFGDGSLYNNHVESWTTSARAYVDECKKEVLCLFDSGLTKWGYIHGFSKELKLNIPSEADSIEYKISFLSGLIASDGCVSKSGVTISNKSNETIQRIVSLAQSCGLVAWSMAEVMKDTNYKKDAKSTVMVIPKSSFKEDWLIRGFHKDRFGIKRTKPKSWKVESVTSTDKKETVYCVEVQGDEKYFTLEGNVYTGNCVGCLKAGWQHWYIVYCTRKDIWNEAKYGEDEIGYAIHKDKDGPVYLEEKEELFDSMIAAGVVATEKTKPQTFWAQARKAVRESAAEMKDLAEHDKGVCLDCTL